MTTPAPVPTQPNKVVDLPVDQAGAEESQPVTDRSVGESAPQSSGEIEMPTEAETTGVGLAKQQSSGSQGPERPVLDKSGSSSKWKSSGTKVKVCMCDVHTYVRVHARQFGLRVQRRNVRNPHQLTAR